MRIYWIIPYKLAVMDVPLDENDIKEITNKGIKALVSLYNIADLLPSWNSLNELHEKIKEYGIEVVSQPTLSKKTPRLERVLELIKWIDEKMSEGKPVAIGCKRGWGRGGALAAAYLVYKGYNPDKANKFIEEVASRYNAIAMESEEQRSLAFRVKQFLAK